jgi:hemolysin III
MDESIDPRWELANALTHGAGAVAALAGAAVLIVAASMYGGTMEIVSSAVFSATVVLL